MGKYKKYIETDNLKDATHIEVSVYYDKGGMSSFTGKTSLRGYYISVIPVKKADGMISFTLFAGYKQLLMETKRYSAKQFEQAVEKSKDVEAEIIAAVKEKYKAA